MEQSSFQGDRQTSIPIENKGQIKILNLQNV